MEIKGPAFCRMISHGFLPLLSPAILVELYYVGTGFFFIFSARVKGSNSIPFCTGVSRAVSLSMVGWDGHGNSGTGAQNAIALTLFNNDAFPINKLHFQRNLLA